MASPQQEGMSHAVHVPCCLNDECKEHMDCLVALLEERGVKCVYQARGDYGLGGLFLDRFKHLFKSCRRTIIHICPQSLQMVKPVKDVFMSDSEKTSFFRIPCSPSSFQDDLGVHMFNVWNLSDEAVRKTFVKEMAYEMSSKMLTQEIPLSFEEVYTIRKTVFTPINIIHRGAEHPVVCLHKLLFLSSDTEEKIRRTVLECTNQEQWSTFLNQTSPQGLFFILNKVLPELYRRRQIIHLAHLAGTHIPALRDRTLRFVQLLLLSNDPTAWSTTDLKETEIAMFNTLLLQKDTMPVNTIVAYLMTLVSYIMACKEANKEKECDDHFGVITSRPLFQAAELKKNKRKSVRGTADLWIKVLHLCVSHWREQKSKKRDVTFKQPKQQWIMELLGFISRIIQLNRNCPFDFRIFPSSQINIQGRGKDSTRGFITILVANVTICGLTALLEHKTTDLVCSSSFNEVCREAASRLIGALSSLCEEDKSLMFQQLTTLLFHHNRHIRMQALYLFVLDNTYSTMTTILWERLVLTTQDLLYPLLQDNRNTKNSHEDEDKDEVRGGWTVVKHKLGADGVLTHVLRPSTYEHRNEVRCSLKDKRFHELRLLKEFQHSNLVELRAFCDMCWPQFYITEDYSTNALQSMLVNKSRNDNCFSLKKLLIFVIDALKGVQFLHENNIVHRDLTAANVFITASGQVKLSGLMQARRPSGDTIRDFECSFIPTRWTAPESLRQCQFSKMSDMWMVGHLIYEMLTHGRLPYADVGPVDSELIPMVVAGRRTLCDEACIPGPVHSVIIQLTKIEPSSRLSEVKAVIDVLAAFVDEMNEDMNSVKFPDIHAKGQAATEHRKGPVISMLDTYFGGFNETLDETSDERQDYINISNRHQRPVRGPMSIKELCPKDFSSDVWSVLTEGRLPGISPLISQPKMNSERELEISFAIPAKYSICRLARAVVRRWLGNDIQDYVECLGNIATAINELHSRGLVLCDFCADTIFIEKVPTPTGQINKVVWFASIANIRSMQHHVNASGQLIEVPPPQNSEARRRAAPEVMKRGLYSHASDVFCFGRLMWWVFNTFCRVEVGEEVNKHALDLLAEVDDTELYSRIADLGAAASVQRPPACPPALYHLMLKCWNPRRSERPSIQVLQELLTGVEDSSRIGNHNQTSEYDYFEGYSEAETDDVYNNPDTINSERGCNVECHNQRAEDDNAEGYSDIPDYHLSGILPESESSWNNDSDEPYERVGSEPVVASGIQRSLPPSARQHYPLPPLPPPPSQSVTQDRESHADRIETGSGFYTISTRNQLPIEHDAQSATGLKIGQTKRKIVGSALASNLSLAEGPLALPFGEQNYSSIQQQEPTSTSKQYPTSLPEHKPSLKAKQPPSTLEPKLPHEQSRSTFLAEQTAVVSPASPPSPLLPHHRHVAQIIPQHQQPQSVSTPPLPPRRYADYERSDPVTSPPSAEAGASSSTNGPPLPPRRPSRSSTLEYSSPPPRPPRGSGLVVTSISVSSLSPTPSNSLLTTPLDPLSPTPSLLPSNPPPLPPRHSLRKPPSTPDQPQESNSPPATSGLSPPMSPLPIVPPQSLLRLEDQSSAALLPQSPISTSLTASSSPAATSRPMPQQTIASSSSGQTSLSRPHPKHELQSCKAHREYCESSLAGGESAHLAGEAKYTSTFTIQLEVKNINLTNKKKEHTLKVLPSTLLTAKERTDAPTHNAFHTTEDTDNKATDDPVDKSIPVSKAIKAIDARTKATEAMDDAVYTNTQATEAMGDPVYTNTQAAEAMDDAVYRNTQAAEAMGDPVYTNTQAAEAMDDAVYRNTQAAEAMGDPVYTNTQAAEAMDDAVYRNTQAAEAMGDPVYTNTQAAEAMGDPVYTNTQAAEAMGDPVYTNTQATEATDDPVYTNTQAAEAMDDPVYTNTQATEGMDDAVYTNTQAVDATDPVYTNTPGNEITDAQRQSATPDSEAREDPLDLSPVHETSIYGPVNANTPVDEITYDPYDDIL